jgi:hypothetical protein
VNENTLSNMKETHLFPSNPKILKNSNIGVESPSEGGDRRNLKYTRL